MTSTTSKQKKIALVTGAGTGIGRAVSMALATDGYLTVLAGRRQAALDAVAAAIIAGGGQAQALVADVTNPDSTATLFDRIRGQFGRLDLLFNNAGASAPATPLEDLPVEAWKSVIDVNLTGVFLCTQGAFRLMKSQLPRGGRIVNNGSLAATTPRPDSAAYTASKHAVLGLTKATALEGRRYDIACGQIDIGNAETSMGSHAARGALQADGSTRVEPMLAVEHVANAVKYMASLPLDANVLSLTVMATNMPFVGRG